MVPFDLKMLAKFGLCSNCSQKLLRCSLACARKIFATACMLTFWSSVCQKYRLSFCTDASWLNKGSCFLTTFFSWINSWSHDVIRHTRINFHNLPCVSFRKHWLSFTFYDRSESLWEVIHSLWSLSCVSAINQVDSSRRTGINHREVFHFSVYWVSRTSVKVVFLWLRLL